MALLDNECDENPIVRRASDAVGAFSCQEFCPGLGRRQVGVVDVKQRQYSPGARLEFVEGAMFSIPEKDETC